jgi:glycosyltransferase involved in cell wall biosynthesis
MQNENLKKISVVMCTYNGEKYLREQLDSIVNQTYPIYEFIIQDDCSTDATFDILSEYRLQYPYIKLYQNEKQKGINENFFSAISLATGDYIALSDQDDVWVLDKLKIQIESIGDNWLSAGRSVPFAENGVTVYLDRRTPNFCVVRLIYINAIQGHTVLFNKYLLPPPIR